MESDAARQMLARYAAGERSFSWIQLAGADLHGADLRDANFYGANLSGSDLRGADLTRANLGMANLHGANLRGANLSDAFLTGAELSEADQSETVRDRPSPAAPSASAAPVQAMPAPFAPLTSASAPPPLATAGVQWCMRCGVGMPPGAAQCPRCGWAPTSATEYTAPGQSTSGAVTRGIGQYVSQPTTVPQGAPRTTTPATQKNAYAPSVSPTVRSSKSPTRSYLQTLGIGVLLVIGGIALPAQTEQCTTDSIGQYCIETVYTYNGVSAPVVKGLLIVAGILCIVVVGFLLISRNTQQK